MQDPHSPSPLAPERPFPHVPPGAVCWCGRRREIGPAAYQLRSLRQPASNRRSPGLPPSFLPPAVLPNYPAAALGGRWRSRLPEKGRGERERAEPREVEGGGGAATWCHGHPGAPEPVRARGTHRGSGGRRSCRQPAEELPGERVERAAGGARGGRARASQQAGE